MTNALSYTTTVTTCPSHFTGGSYYTLAVTIDSRTDPVILRLSTAHYSYLETSGVDVFTFFNELAALLQKPKTENRVASPLAKR